MERVYELVKRKVIVYLAGLSASGGKERVVANLLKDWNERYDIMLITKDKKESFYPVPKDIKRISLGLPFIDMMYNLKASGMSRAVGTLLNMSISIWRLKKVLNKLDYDYVYVTSPLNAYEAYCAMKEPAKKLVISEHASIYAYNSVYSKMKYKVYPKAYCVSVPNRMDIEKYNAWGCNAIYVPHPITFSSYRDRSCKEKIVLNVGRLTSDKQQDYLIRIWKTIDPEVRKGWKLWIVGSGEEEDKLKEIANRMKDGTIEFFPSTKEISEIYKKASLFAFTSRSEGFGMVLLEAMAYGIPCLSFDCPSGPRDVVCNNVNGYLVPNNDVIIYRETLERAMKLDDDKYEKLVEHAYKTVDEWSTEKIMLLWDQIYR